MLKVLVVTCFLAAVNASPLHGDGLPSEKIVGGVNTTINEVPWQVALEEFGGLFCGGSIISENYILTAASCTIGRNLAKTQVRSGSSFLESNGTLTNITSIVQHPKFSLTTLDFDVAVIKLSDPIVFTTNQTAVLLSSAGAAEGDTAQIAGWGYLDWEDSHPSPYLQSVEVPVVSSRDCADAYTGMITDRMFCAGEEGKDNCAGDNGGALTVNGAQVGIASWGLVRCAEEGSPGVYSNVAVVADFINQNSNNEATWV